MEQTILDFIKELFVGNGLVIAVATYVIAEVVKPLLQEEHRKFIPLGVAIIGAILGVAIKGIFPNDDIIVCAIKGMALGWASTGLYEMFKNLASGSVKG